MKKIFLTLALLGFFFPFNLSAEEQECYMIMAGKDTTQNGEVLVAHNNDLSGTVASSLGRWERATHRPDEVIEFPSGLVIPQAPLTYEWFALQIYKGTAEGDTIAINEYGVSIAGGVAQGAARNAGVKAADPLLPDGLTGGVRYIALQRSQTAEECVSKMGSLYSQYGITYPSGVAVADKDEIWFIEASGGHYWAAVRIPDDKVLIVANAYRIQEIDCDNDPNVKCAPGLVQFSIDNGLYDPASGPFNFAKAFGIRARYNVMREWRGIDLVAPYLGVDLAVDDFPMYVSPDELVSIQSLISVLRDTYKGTPYDRFLPGGAESRPIGGNHAIHVSVVQLRDNMPVDIGAVMWAGLGPVYATPFMPVYYGATSYPAPFMNISGPVFDADSAFWTFRTLGDMIDPHYMFVGEETIAEYQIMEETFFAEQDAIDQEALAIFNKSGRGRGHQKQARRFLTDYSTGALESGLAMAKEITNELYTTFAYYSKYWDKCLLSGDNTFSNLSDRYFNTTAYEMNYDFFKNFNCCTPGLTRTFLCGEPLEPCAPGSEDLAVGVRCEK